MRLPNAPPGLLDHPVPELRGTPGLYTNRHAVSYFTALLCGIPLSRLHRPGGDEPAFGIHGDGRTGILGVAGLRQQAVRIGHNLAWERLPGPGLIPVELRGALETGREVPGKALPLGYVLRFDNDNDVLVGILQCRTKPLIVLERVNGHDGPVEIVEWVVAFGESFLYALQNEAIQAGETN